MSALQDTSAATTNAAADHSVYETANAADAVNERLFAEQAVKRVIDMISGAMQASSPTTRSRDYTMNWDLSTSLRVSKDAICLLSRKGLLLCGETFEMK